MKKIFFIRKILLSFFLCAYSLWGLDFTVTQTGGSSTSEATPSSYIEFELDMTDTIGTESETLYCTVNDGTEAKCLLSNSSSSNSFVIAAGIAPSAFNSLYKFRVYGKSDNILDGDKNYKVAIATSRYKNDGEATEEGMYQSDPTDGYIFNLTNIDDGDDSANTTSTPSNDKIIVDLFDSISSEDGDKASFSIVLSQEPTADVTINFSSNNLLEGTLSTSSVTFNSSNWDERQRVDITGVDDATVDGDIDFSILILSAISTDIYYSTEDASDLTITNLDNDVVVSTTLEKEIIITPVTGTTVTEGNSLEFNIKLNQDPLGSISLSPTIPGGTVSPTFPTVLFDSINWDTNQTITVSIPDDDYSYGEKTSTLSIVSTVITVTIPISDGVWNDSIDLTIEDDDILPINITATDSLTSESGDTGTINIELTEVPTQDVVFTIESLDESEGIASSSTVTFTQAEGITNKDVTITGVDDSFLDFDSAYKIRVTWESSDEKFNIALGIEVVGSEVAILLPYNREDFDFINSDDETDILTITSIDDTTSENGETASFSVVLNYEPDEFVRVYLNSTDSTEGIVNSPSSGYLDFTNQNWDTPQVVTVLGVNDNELDSSENYEIELRPQGKRDNLYDGTVLNKKVLLSNSNTNNTPSISIARDVNTIKNTTLDLDFSVYNTDGYSFSLVKKVDPEKGNITISDNQVSYVPNINYLGKDSFILTFSAGYGYTEDITIEIDVVEDVQIITNLVNQTQEEDGEGLRIELSSFPESLTSSSYNITTSNDDVAKVFISNGELIIIPIKNAHGSVTISLTTTVGGVTSPIKSFVYTLTIVNDAPIIQKIDDIVHEQSAEIIEGTISFDIFDDDDISSLSFENTNTTLINNDDINVVKLSQTQGEISYKIAANKVGISKITIIATDTDNSSTSESFNITVNVENDALCVSDTKRALTFDTIRSQNSNQNDVTSELDLISSISTVCDTTITWQSSDENIISNTGIVKQSSSETTILLSGTITKGSFSDKVEFLVTVPSNNVSNNEAIEKLLFELIKGNNQRKDQIVYPLNLIDNILGKTISWSSDNIAINSFSGFILRPSIDTSVTLSARIGTITKEFTLIVLKQEISDFDKVLADKELLTVSSILEKNLDADSIIYDLLKPLPVLGANGSDIVWQSSNTTYITNNGDVYRDEIEDKVVILTATITNGLANSSKPFILTVLKNMIDDVSSVEFKKFENTSDGSQVVIEQDGESVTTTLTFADSILEGIDQILSSNSIKTMIELFDNIINIYLNTDGTSQTTIQNSDGTTSTIKTEVIGSITTVDEDGNVQTKIEGENGSFISLNINSDGTVSYNLVDGSKTTIVSSNIPGTNAKMDKDGNLIITSPVTQNGFVYKVTIETNNEGNLIAKYDKVDLSTGNIFNTYTSMPFPPGSIVNIVMINGAIYISITVPLDNNMVIN